MRWFWIERFTEFVSGERAVAIKNVSLAEDHVHDVCPGYPMMPASLILEGMAQTAGLLIGECNRFEERVVLAKVSKASFNELAVPGDTLTYTATLEDIKPDGAVAGVVTTNGQRILAEAELFFAHLDHRIEETLFDPADFMRMLRVFRLYDVGCSPDGRPLEIPAHLLAAEQAEAKIPTTDTV